MAGEDCCKGCLGFIITSGFTALFLWLSLRVDEPKCFIDSFYVPAFNKSTNSQNNQTIVFMVKFENGNKDKGIRYDTVNLTFGIFVDPNTTRPIGNTTIPDFYQGHSKKAKKWGSIDAHGVNRTLVNGKSHFRVDFTTSVKYKIMLWFTKRHRLWGGANVEINDSGEKAHKKGIRLGSSPPKIESGVSKNRGWYCALWGLLLGFNFA